MIGIVVGVDESDGARRALRWAVEEGSIRGLPITAVLAWDYLDQHPTGQAFDPRYGADDAQDAVEAIVSTALGADDAARVTARAVCDLPRRALLDASDDADLLVVGARGAGGFVGLLLGSVSAYCVRHSTVPTAVVRTFSRAGDDHQLPIVVAVDGSPASRRAFAWAAEEARLRSAGLTLLHAVDDKGLTFEHSPSTSRSERMARARDVAAGVIDGSSAADFVEEITIETPMAAPAAAIVRSSAAADLVVVGSRGLGGVKGLLLGSVAEQVAAYAVSSVVIVPDDARRASLGPGPATAG